MHERHDCRTIDLRPLLLRRILLAALVVTSACDEPDALDGPDALDDDASAHGPAAGTGLVSTSDPAAFVTTTANPGFELPWWVPVGTPATTLAVCTSPPGGVGVSASKHWTTYANALRTSINSWIADAPTYPLGGPAAPSNLVAVGGGQDGLVQVLAPQCVATDVNKVSGWVYVIAGEVELQLGNGGAGGGTPIYSTTHGEWEYLATCGRPDMWNNEITIYGTEPAVYYVDDVQVSFSEGCPSCPHPSRTEGVALSPDCGACEELVCTALPHCCDTEWDASCVALAVQSCPFDCSE